MSEATLQNQVLGGWSKFSCEITPEASEVFKAAFKGFVGVSYTPVAFASQIVAGTKYSFFVMHKLYILVPLIKQL